ncbi:MAG: hypothetical protein IKH28_02950 [Lachnospiraceae bacterium]|nr:hypothetical protein [Lachnospiraceae bacterium]
MKNPEDRKTQIIKIRISEGTREQLEAIAARQMITMSEYIRRLIEMDLKNPEK